MPSACPVHRVFVMNRSRIGTKRGLRAFGFARRPPRLKTCHPRGVDVISTWRAAALAATLICCAVVTALAADVEGGSLEGVRDGALTVYKGVPFATPPLGE